MTNPKKVLLMENNERTPLNISNAGKVVLQAF